MWLSIPITESECGQRERERKTEKSLNSSWFVLVPAGDRREHLTCWCVIVMSVSPHGCLSALSVCLTSGSGAPEGTLCLWTMRIKWCPVVPSPVRRASEPSVTRWGHKQAPLSFPAVWWFHPQAEMHHSVPLGEQMAGWEGRGHFPKEREDRSLSPSPESETLHLRSAWWAFKSLKWDFGSVAPQEAAHLSPKRPFV